MRGDIWNAPGSGSRPTSRQGGLGWVGWAGGWQPSGSQQKVRPLPSTTQNGPGRCAGRVGFPRALSVPPPHVGSPRRRCEGLVLFAAGRAAASSCRSVLCLYWNPVSNRYRGERPRQLSTGLCPSPPFRQRKRELGNEGSARAQPWVCVGLYFPHIHISAF